MSVYAKILIDNIKSLAKRIMQVTLIIAVVIAVVSLFLKSIYPHSTQNTNVSSFSIERQKIYRVLNDPKNTKTSVQRGTIAGMRVITCFFVGETCSTNPNDPKNNIKKGFVGKLSGVITLPLLNPPASGVYYVKNTLSHFGFIPSAYAAEGIGFSSLNPLFKVWRGASVLSLFADKGNTGGELIGNILFDLPNALMRAIPIVSDFAQIMGVIIGFWKIFPFLWTIV